MGKRKIKLELIQDKKMRYVSCNNPYFFILIPDCLIDVFLLCRYATINESVG